MACPAVGVPGVKELTRGGAGRPRPVVLAQQPPCLSWGRPPSLPHTASPTSPRALREATVVPGPQVSLLDSRGDRRAGGSLLGARAPWGSLSLEVSGPHSPSVLNTATLSLVKGEPR